MPNDSGTLDCGVDVVERRPQPNRALSVEEGFLETGDVPEDLRVTDRSLQSLVNLIVDALEIVEGEVDTVLRSRRLFSLILIPRTEGTTIVANLGLGTPGGVGGGNGEGRP